MDCILGSLKIRKHQDRVLSSSDIKTGGYDYVNVCSIKWALDNLGRTNRQTDNCVCVNVDFLIFFKINPYVTQDKVSTSFDLQRNGWHAPWLSCSCVSSRESNGQTDIVIPRAPDGHILLFLMMWWWVRVWHAVPVTSGHCGVWTEASGQPATSGGRGRDRERRYEAPVKVWHRALASTGSLQVSQQTSVIQLKWFTKQAWYKLACQLVVWPIKKIKS